MYEPQRCHWCDWTSTGGRCGTGSISIFIDIRFLSDRFGSKRVLFLFFVLFLMYFTQHFKCLTVEFNNVGIISFTPASLFSVCVLSLGIWANLVQALVNLFPRAVSLLFNGLFVQNILYLFHTRSTAEGFLYFRELAAAVEGGLQRQDWRRLHAVSHWRIATRLLYLFYLLSFIHLFLLFLLPSFCTLFSPFFYHPSFSHSFYDMLWAQITATDIICNVHIFSLSHNGKS